MPLAYNTSRVIPTFYTEVIQMDVFMDNAKVMSKGQITIPKDVRDALGVSSGDRVTFIVEGQLGCLRNADAPARNDGRGRTQRTYKRG